jgi:hypothetical protein
MFSEMQFRSLQALSYAFSLLPIYQAMKADMTGVPVVPVVVAIPAEVVIAIKRSDSADIFLPLILKKLVESQTG